MSVEYYPLKIIKKIQETEDSYSFYFSVPEEYKSIFSYHSSQFITFKFSIDGKNYVRSYSLSSSSFLDEPLQTSIKRVKDGIVSNYMIDFVKKGDEVLSQKPLGDFFNLPKTLESQTYILFGAGIGITPLFAILKTVLSSNLCEKMILIYSNRNEEDIIYRNSLREWEERYPEKLKIQNILSKKEGRLNSEKLSQIMKEVPLKNSLFYLCGPKDYMNLIKRDLIEKGYSSESIHREDFNVVPVHGPKPDKYSVFFEAKGYQEGEPEILEAVLNGEEIKIDLNREKSLLEQLLEKGYNPPFSCTSGSCMTCMAKLKEGKVFQLEEGILDEENIQSLELLTCQCYPLSKKVLIDYDNL